MTCHVLNNVVWLDIQWKGFELIWYDIW